MSPRLLLAALLAVFPISFSVFAEEPANDPVYLEPADAGPDFAIQGEYVGDRCAAQVIALGNGKFHIVGWTKGLPGAVDDPEKKVEVDAQMEGERAVFDGGGWKGSIALGQLLGTNDNGQTFELRHTERESPTLGAKPPEGPGAAPFGAIVLFDGTNADAWNNGQVDVRHFLAGGAKSKQKFDDFTLHVEFRTPFRPLARGQARGNSGVYLQDRYEIQILDSFGLKGENNECGGIYSKVKPRVNACFPPLSWQTYDVDFQAVRYDAAGKKFKNAVVSVRQNGILIHDHVEIPGSTPGGQPETREPGPIQLQGHNNPVFFRNIWIVSKK
jgi:hypothetical protein